MVQEFRLLAERDSDISSLLVEHLPSTYPRNAVTVSNDLEEMVQAQNSGVNLVKALLSPDPLALAKVTSTKGKHAVEFLYIPGGWSIEAPSGTGMKFSTSPNGNGILFPCPIHC